MYDYNIFRAKARSSASGFQFLSMGGFKDRFASLREAPIDSVYEMHLISALVVTHMRERSGNESSVIFATVEGRCEVNQCTGSTKRLRKAIIEKVIDDDKFNL